MSITGDRSIGDRAVLALLMALMTLGSLALWTVVPGGTLWAVSQVESSVGVNLFLALVGIPTAILLFATILMRLNALYVRVACSTAGEDEDRERYMRGPLEWLIVCSLILAVVTLIVWMAFFSEDPFVWTPAAP